MNKILFYTALSLFFISACNRKKNDADAYGNFEATEVILSSEATGKLISLTIEEGQHLQEGDIIGYIDSTQLYLKKQQLIAARNGVATKNTGIAAQIDVLNTQKANLLKEKKRFADLVHDNSATQKQVDDIVAQISVIDQQIKQAESQSPGVGAELNVYSEQIKQLNDQLEKSIIRSPITGVVLMKYAQEGEVTTIGKPLLKIADLDEMVLRAYISETQLPQIRLNQTVKVQIDMGDGTKDFTGTVSWISGTAEFTPKIIQTKEERVNLVYAMKVKMKNDGSLKIGMPGEVLIINN